jgi:toxin-antitoxin system PIN domain toxin
VILPDVNVLVHAFVDEDPRHARYAQWLNDVVSGAEELLLTDAALTGFMRVVTHPKVYAKPAPIGAAMQFVSSLQRSPRARSVEEHASVWRQLAALTTADPGIRGVVVPDAYLAAVAISHKARIATRDRGFGRFPGLRWFDPAAA